MTGQQLEIRRVGPAVGEALGQFLEDLRRAGDERWFHPHPLTTEAAGLIAEDDGPDYYCVVLADDAVVGYGMLRGWAEGFATPSLGIAIHPSARGRGVARALMLFLHAVASYRGATDVRLTVAIDNTTAASLYESLGYRIEKLDEDRLLGRIQLNVRTPSGGAGQGADL